MPIRAKYTLIFLVSLLFLSLFLTYDFLSRGNRDINEDSPDFFFGVDVAYGDVDEIKYLIDEVNSYTNLVLIGLTGISYNTAKLDEICQYIYMKKIFTS